MPRIRRAFLAGLAGVAAAAALAGCASSAGFADPHPAWLTAQPASGEPAYFIENENWSPYGGYQSSRLVVRRTATGQPVTQRAGRLNPLITAIAAIGRGPVYVAAQETAGNCSSQLYWFELNSAGQAGPFTKIGPLMTGLVDELAASADGRTIAYTLGNCADLNKGADKGYLKVADLTTGRVRKWSSVRLAGKGQIGVASNLSLSADGRLLAFVGWTPAGSNADVDVLSTRSRTGRLAEHSRAVLPLRASAMPRDSIALTPGGASFYLCTADTEAGARVTKIASYSAASGRLLRRVASLAATGAAGSHVLTGCAMSVSQNGWYALVAYDVRYAAGIAPPATVSVARITLATGARKVTPVQVREDQYLAGPDAAGISVAW